MEKTRVQQKSSESKTLLVEQINVCLRSGDYSRALDSLRNTDAAIGHDPELAELEKRAQDGVQRTADANRLITESQELFAERKSAEAIALLRKAYELDKNNSLARAILANALVEHAQSMVESSWLEAETMTNQALTLNPAHPTAKTILGLIVRKKETGSVEEWISQARKLQSAGDLFAALGGIAEGLAVHPHDAKLLQIQDEIQRDQAAQRRQARRGDLDELRRLQREIEGTAELAAKQALAVRIQTVAAKHWTDGEILSIANALLLRLGLVSDEGPSASMRKKGVPLILHVPRPSVAKPLAEGSKLPAVTVVSSEVPVSPVLATEVKTGEIVTGPDLGGDAGMSARATTVLPIQDPSSVAVEKEVATSTLPPNPIAAEKVGAGVPRAGKIPLRTTPRGKLRTAATKGPLSPAQAAAPVVESFATTAKFAPASLERNQPTRSKSIMLVVMASAATILVVGALYLFARKHPVAPQANRAEAVPVVSAPTASVPPESAPVVSAPAAVMVAPTQPAPEAALPASPVSADTPGRKVTPDNTPAAKPAQSLGTLLVVAGQDNATVFLNGKPQSQLTQGGQLRLPNLEPRDYVVKIAKGGFQDPAPQKIRIQKGEQASLIFKLQPQPRLASLALQGGAPGTAVLVDQILVGTVQSDGTLSVSSVSPGDHTVELRKDRFKPRQLKKHFVAGGTISLAAADAALEAAATELKITFVPADASVAIVKGDFLKIVSSGVPLSVAPGTYTLTARTPDRFTRSSTFEVVAGQSKTLDLSLAPSGMSKWNDAAGWKREGDAFVRKGGDFVLYGVAPTSGTFGFSAMLTKGRVLQWVLNYTDPKNYVLFQIDENNFYRSVIHNGEKTDEIIVPHKGEKKSFRMIQIRVSPGEIIHEIKQGDRWTVLDRWAQPGTNLGSGKFGFYIPGNDQVALSSFAHYADLNIH